MSRSDERSKLDWFKWVNLESERQPFFLTFGGYNGQVLHDYLHKNTNMA